MKCLWDSGTAKSSTKQSDIHVAKDVNKTFDFDREIFSSRVYLNATRSNMIFSIQTGGHENRNSASSSQLSAASPRIRISRVFSLHSSRHSNSDSLSSIHSLDRERQGLSTSMNQNVAPLNIQVLSKQNADIQEIPRRFSTGVKSALSGSPSILKFPERIRIASPSSTQFPLTPQQAPPGATKVLLLGCNASGKTTIIKSLEAAFGYYNTAVRQSYLTHICNSVIESTKIVSDYRKDFLTLRYGMRQKGVSRRKATVVRNATDMNLGTSSLPSDSTSVIYTRWNDLEIRSTFAKKVFYSESDQ